MVRYYVIRWTLGSYTMNSRYEINEQAELVKHYLFLKNHGFSVVLYEIKETEVNWTIGGNGG